MLQFNSATEIVALLKSRQLSVQEVTAIHLEQIERVNPIVNAICTLVAERAMDEARAKDSSGRRNSEPKELLYGLPVAIKDLTPTRGIRTTYGSPIFKDHTPDADALVVERLKAHGAIILGKTNTPEFGAGSNTFNSVFGATRNPYDLSKCAGGSSGGSAVALACGMVPIADGSDMGGSLRNPASFNNVVGLRPSPGRIPRYPCDDIWDTLSVQGPMARSVSDVALLLSVLAGPDARDPISIAEPPWRFSAPSATDFDAARVAWSPDLGQLPVQREVTEVISPALSAFTDMGCVLEEAHPDFSGAAEIFQTLRAQSYAAAHAENVAKHRELIKESIIWNVEKGMGLGVLDIAKAQTERSRLYHRVREFFEDYDFLLLPSAQVTPFPLELEWVREIEGMRMETYIDWMNICSFITLTEHPAISVPCGFTSAGLPVGIQIVGRHRGERRLLQFAHAFEQRTGYGTTRPRVAA